MKIGFSARFSLLLLLGPLLLLSNLTTTVYAVAANDVCTGAVPLTVDVPMNGNFSEATRDADVAEDCITPGNGPALPGLWYTLVGTGRRVTLFSCADSSSTRLSVYRGGECNALKCVAGGVAPCGFDEIGFFALPDVTYYILQQSGRNDTLIDLGNLVRPCGIFGWNLFCPLSFEGVIGGFIRGILAALGL